MPTDGDLSDPHGAASPAPPAPDAMVLGDGWSDLARYRALPEIDHGRLHAWRTARLKDQLRQAGAAMAVLVSPVSLRYAVDYRTYGLFQAHIPSTYLFLPLDGPTVIYGAYGTPQGCDDSRPGRPISVFDGGPDLAEAARLLADDVVRYLAEIGSPNRRVAVEYVNPSITQALLQRGIEVIDGVRISEMRTPSITSMPRCRSAWVIEGLTYSTATRRFGEPISAR
ncbi:MAG TPA: hypothetical protein VLA52_10155 [Thermohalobaculum sp.]|nr:hypothetical protein [Thermohalobaculum sp.]